MDLEGRARDNFEAAEARKATIEKSQQLILDARRKAELLLQERGVKTKMPKGRLIFNAITAFAMADPLVNKELPPVGDRTHVHFQMQTSGERPIDTFIFAHKLRGRVQDTGFIYVAVDGVDEYLKLSKDAAYIKSPDSPHYTPTFDKLSEWGDVINYAFNLHLNGNFPSQSRPNT